MANSLQTLIPILLLLAAAAALSQSTSFRYDFIGPPNFTGLTFQGDTHFPPIYPFLRLTSARKYAVGRVLYSDPVRFSKTGGQIDFEATLRFLIRRRRGHAAAADGLVFFIAPAGSTPPNGAGGANFGVFDSTGNGHAVFAVEFDTFVNPEWDPDYLHVGIDIGSRRSSNTTDVGDAIVGQEVAATISYAAATKVISVAVSVRTKTFEVSYEYDLGSFLPQLVQVGLSASTGNDTATHDVVSWYFTSTMVDTGEIRQVV